MSMRDGLTGIPTYRRGTGLSDVFMPLVRRRDNRGGCGVGPEPAHCESSPSGKTRELGG
jgi:hypothetical protein